MLLHIKDTTSSKLIICRNYETGAILGIKSYKAEYAIRRFIDVMRITFKYAALQFLVYDDHFRLLNDYRVSYFYEGL